jgi:uncharacterized membrane protein YhhN
MPGQSLKTTVPLILLSMTVYLLLLPFIQYPMTTILKPIPIALLMVFTLQVNPQRQIKLLLLSALGFSLIGDMVLTLTSKEALHAGILSFMAAHCTYICLFLKNIQFQKKRFFSFLPILALVIISLYYLWPYFGEMKKPVAVYICLLTLMVFFSFQVKQSSFLIGSGATLFLLSDFILALDLFVSPNNKPTEVLIMFLYYAAQFLLVIGITQKKHIALLECRGIFLRRIE